MRLEDRVTVVTPSASTIWASLAARNVSKVLPATAPKAEKSTVRAWSVPAPRAESTRLAGEAEPSFLLMAAAETPTPTLLMREASSPSVELAVVCTTPSEALPSLRVLMATEVQLPAPSVRVTAPELATVCSFPPKTTVAVPPLMALTSMSYLPAAVLVVLTSVIPTVVRPAATMALPSPTGSVVSVKPLAMS